MQYEERFVAFLDILGFSKIIEKTKTDDNELAKLIDVLERIKNGDAEIKKSDQNPTDIKMTTFSDSIVISCKLSKDFDIFVELLLRSNIWLLEQGYFVRGGITYGKLYHNEDIILGPAFIEAYELEKLADYPRIVLSEKARKEMSPKQQENGKTITVAMLARKYFFNLDCDGMYYIDYFARYNEDINEYEKFINNLEIRTDNNTADNKEKEYIVKKMKWVKNKILLSKKAQKQNQTKTFEDLISDIEGSK